MSFSRLCRTAVPVALIAATVSANAQQYPTRAIRVISPYPAGSASDTVTRVVMDQVSQVVRQPVVIEMRPGAGGSIGFSSVAKS
ncbi:MAG: tripartite tricarboxylate transporter substrate binding protein, partial [Pseudolabrys sp.]